MSEVLFIAQVMRDLAAVRRCVGALLACAVVAPHFLVLERVEASCGSLVDVTGLLLDLVLRGTSAFGGVRIPGGVAHIEIGLGVNMQIGPGVGSLTVQRFGVVTGNIPPFFFKSQPCNSASGAKKLFPSSFADASS